MTDEVRAVAIRRFNDDGRYYNVDDSVPGLTEGAFAQLEKLGFVAHAAMRPRRAGRKKIAT